MAEMNTESGAMTFREYIKANRDNVGDFQSVPQYFRDGDFLTVFFVDDMAYAVRVDDVLTIYLSDGTGDLVGCKIKGIRQLVQNVSSLVEVDHDSISFGLVLLSAAGHRPPKEMYYDVREKAKGLKIDASQITNAA